MTDESYQKSNNIPIIAFEGLNSTGKTTQILKLRDNLERLRVQTKILKGNGSRKGEGRLETDPLSVWWQQNHHRIMSTDINSDEGLKMAELAANRLNREIYIEVNRALPRYLRQHGLEKALIIMDRSIISRLFILKRYKENITMEDIKYFTQGNGKKKDIPIPDLIFLFHAPQEILLERNSGRSDGEDKIKFNETIITSKYNEFEQMIGSIPDEIKNRILIIDSSKTIDEIQEEILIEVLNLIALNK